MTDEEFFAANPHRQARIREPKRELQKDKQRAVRFLSECELQFRSLGKHRMAQRRIVVYRVPADHPTHANTLMVIPVLDDVAVHSALIDTDEVLLPFIHGLMEAQQ